MLGQQLMPLARFANNTARQITFTEDPYENAPRLLLLQVDHTESTNLIQSIQLMNL